MVVSDILAEAKNVLGSCNADTVYRRITDAVRLANNQLKGDANVAQMDLCVCNGCVTLPADVGTVLAVNVGGRPTLMRDQWFQYHINGSGSENSQPCSYTDELGSVTTFKEPSGPVKLVAEIENALDSNCTLRVFGWDENGKRIYTEGANSVLEDGILIPTVYGYSVPNPDAPSVARIDRIQKSATNGFVKLIAIDPTTLASHTLIGYYQPWETNPNYRRIRVGDQSWVRMKYKKKDLEVRGSADWINIENREALILLLKAVKFRLDNQIDQAKNYEIEGMRLLSNEIESLRPPAISGPQIIFDDFPYTCDRLFY
jgi:hypothetical protein